MVNFGYFLLRNADCFPDRTAVVCEDRELTYSQLNAECNRLANALKLKGLRRGDRLALLMKSSTEWLVVWYACQKLGVAVLPRRACQDHRHGRLQLPGFRLRIRRAG